MDGELLTLTAAVEPFVTDGDVIEAIIVIAHTGETVEGVTLYVVGPIIFGINTAVGEAIGSILNGILFFLGCSHLAV